MKGITQPTYYHRYALILAFLVSILYGAHHIVISQQLATQNQGYHPIVINEDEALFTGPKAHAAEMGEIVVGDFNVAEYRDTRIYVLPFLSPLVMGNIARAVGSIERAFIVGDFLFPPIIFLLFYALLFLLSRHRLLSLFGAALFIFIPQFLTAFPPVTPYLQALMLTFAAKGSSLYFSRVEDPQVTMPLYLAAIILVLLIFKGRKEKWVIAAGGIAYGLLFYSYFYYWVWITLGLAIGAALAWHAKMPEMRNRLLACIGLGFAISIPHWINAYFITNLPQYSDLFDRLRPELGRALNLEAIPVFQYAIHAALIAAAWLLYRAADNGTALFFAAFLAPVYIAYNMQIITGFNVHPDHWPKTAMPLVNTAFLVLGLAAYRAYGHRLRLRILTPLAAATTAFLIFKAATTEIALVRFASLLLITCMAAAATLVWAVRKYPILRPSRIFTAAALFAIALFFLKGLIVQRQFISRNAPKTIPQEEFESYQWLSRHTPAYSAVASPSFTTNARLQLYTRNRLFLPNGYNTIAGDQELWQRLRITNALFETGTTTYRSYLEGQTDLGGGGEDDAPVDNLYFSFKPSLDRLAVYYLFHMKYHDSSPGSTFRSSVPIALPPAVVERETQDYENLDFRPNSPLPYRLDYFYYGPRERLLAPEASNRLAAFEKVYEVGEIAIYRYTHGD